jgi:hypothetical protein
MAGEGVKTTVRQRQINCRHVWTVKGVEHGPRIGTRFSMQCVRCRLWDYKVPEAVAKARMENMFGTDPA